MDCLLISIRNDLLKICEEVNLIKDYQNRNTEQNESISENNDEKLEIAFKKEDKNNKNSTKEKLEVNNASVKSKSKRNKKEIPLEDRCIKMIIKDGIEVRCSFRKIENNLCKRHLKK